MSADGKGVAAANAIAVASANPQIQSAVPVFACAASECNSTPIPLSPNETVYLILYGTGIRNRSSVAKVTANLGGVNIPVLYAGPQGTYDGLDQVNLALPLNLRGSGQVNVVLTVDGQISNVVIVAIQ